MTKRYIPHQFAGVRKCNYGRSWCQFFAPRVGEQGMCFTKKELEDKIIALEKDIKSIKKTLKEN